MEDEGSVTVTQKVEVGANREVQYTQLISELQAIGTERAFRIELEKVEAKYEMGEAISRSGLYEPYAYGAKLIPMIAKDLGMAERTLYWVLQFYAKVQEVGGLDTFLKDVPKHQIKWTHVRKMLETPRDGGELPPGDVPPPPEDDEERAKPFGSAAKAVLGYSRKSIGGEWTEADHDQLEWWLQPHRKVKDRRPHRATGK